ncbi:hypothetical protein [Mucilaginibacter panaciglaebae]|uniref:Uncharacterized protein n=1 Tax=Mucilaginibacter panaciglaebae TaxID=502331 RepID=A0ABP7WSS9_9SPHI
MESIYIQILEELSKAQLEKRHDITIFSRTLFNRPCDNVDLHFDLVGDEIESFLLIMNTNSHIKYEKHQYGAHDKFEASITTIGLDYLEKRKLYQSNILLNESVTSLNNATINNFRAQKWFSIGTVFFTFVTAVMGVLTFFSVHETSAKTGQLEQNIQSVKEGLKNQKTEAPHPQSQKAFHR